MFDDAFHSARLAVGPVLLEVSRAIIGTQDMPKVSPQNSSIPFDPFRWNNAPSNPGINV
jgi:hypothetical protein